MLLWHSFWLQHNIKARSTPCPGVILLEASGLGNLTILGSRYHCLSRVVALKDLNRPSLNEVQGSEGFSGRFFLEGDCRAQLTSPFTISSCQALDPPPLPQCYCSHHRQHGLPDFHISHFILIQGVVHDVLSVPLQCSPIPSLSW